MNANEIFAKAARDIHKTAGEAATFTPVGGEAIPCHVHVMPNIQLQPEGYNAQVTQLATVIEAALSELGRVPTRGDTFTISAGIYAGTYIVDALLENDGYTVRVSVK